MNDLIKKLLESGKNFSINITIENGKIYKKIFQLKKILTLKDIFDLHPDENDPDAKWYTNDEVIKLLGNNSNKFTVGKELKVINVKSKLNNNRKASYFLKKKYKERPSI